MKIYIPRRSYRFRCYSNIGTRLVVIELPGCKIRMTQDEFNSVNVKRTGALSRLPNRSDMDLVREEGE